MSWVDPVTGAAILLAGGMATWHFRMRRGLDAIGSANILTFLIVYFVVLTALTILPRDALAYLLLELVVYVGMLLLYDDLLAIVRRHTHDRPDKTDRDNDP